MIIKTILFCWEYGAGLGHISALKTIARNFDSQKYRLILVNPQHVHLSADQSFHEIVEFPDTSALYVKESSVAGFVSFNSTIQSFGLNNPRLMFTRLKLWEKLFNEYSPVLVIGDYAPLALSVARNLKIPTVAVGNGYTLPPSNIEFFPKFVNREDPVSGQELLLSFNHALRLAGMTEISKLPEIFKSDIQGCFTDPLLDPFGKIRNPPAVGPLLRSKNSIVSENRGQKLFVYLSHCKLETHRIVLEALKTIEIPIDLYSLQVDLEGRAFAQDSNISFLKEPISLEQICRDYQFAVHLGGHGFTLELLYAGMPQLLLPIDIEKILLAQSMLNQGLAQFLRVDYERPSNMIASKIKEVMADRETAGKVSAFSNGIDREKWQDNQLALMAQIGAII